MANHPHNKDRPESLGVRRALEKADIEALKIALTPRQRAYCHEYVVDFKGNLAAIRAGYAPKWADQQSRNLQMNEGVREYINYLTTSKQAKVMSINPEYLLQKLSEIMNAEGGRPADKLRAVEMYMKHLGMFVDKTEITGKDGDAIRIEQQVKQEAEGFLSTIRRLAEKKEDTLQ